MASLFISYSRKDIAFAHKITPSFEDQGLDFWIDWEGIPPTVDWWKEIQQGIEEADVFLFLLSPDSATSKVCQQEIDHAVKNGKRLIPVVIRDIKGDEAPAEFKPLNWIFLRESDDFESGFHKIITAIKTDYAWVQSHRQLQIKALEWERNGRQNGFLLHEKELQDAETQLVANSSKDPSPTDLQREYVLKSRQVAIRTSRTITSSIVAGLIAVTILAVYGFIQTGLARTAQANALANAETAQAASTLAFNNAATAKSNAEESQRQATLSLARQLVLEAQSARQNNPDETTAVLLAIQSMKLDPSVDAAQIIQDYKNAHITKKLPFNEFVNSMTLSSNGKYLLIGTGNVTQVVDITNGEKLSQMETPNAVIQVYFDPEAKYAVSTSCPEYDSQSLCLSSDIQVWNPVTGEPISKISNIGSIDTIAFSSDGELIAMGGCEVFAEDKCQHGSISLWHTATGEQIFYHPTNAAVVSAYISPDKKVLSASGNQLFKTWEIETGNETTPVEAQWIEGYILLSQDGRFILSLNENTAEIWDSATATKIITIETQSFITMSAISPNGALVAFADFDGNVSVWDIKTGKPFGTMLHSGSVQTIAFSPDSQKVISGAVDNLAIVWDALTGKEITHLIHDQFVYKAFFTPDGDNIISEDGQTVLVWEATTGAEFSDKYSVKYRGLQFSRNPVFSRDGQFFLAVYCYDFTGECKNSTVSLGRTKSEADTSQIEFEGSLHASAIRDDGTAAALSGCELIYPFVDSCTKTSVLIWTLIPSNDIKRLWQEDGSNYEIEFSPDGQYLLSYGGHSTSIWNVATGKKVSQKFMKDWVRYAAFSPDGKYVISGDGNLVTVWSTMTGEELFNINNKGFSSFAVSTGGAYVVTSNCNQYIFDITCSLSTAQVWDTASGREVSQFILDKSLDSLSFSLDSLNILSRSSDDTVRIWETFTGKRIFDIQYEGYVTNAYFSQDAKYIFIQSGSTLSHWIWQPQDLITNVCKRTGRNLSADEWNQYIKEGIISYQNICSVATISPEPIAP